MTKLVDFSKFTSIKIGGVHEVKIISSFEESFSDYVVVGGGNNLLVSNNPPKIAILGKEFDYIDFSSGVIEIGGCFKSSKIYNFAKKNDFGGFEFLKNIPATLGGLIKMNAGLCGFSISDNLISVRLANGWVDVKDIEFSYRHCGIDECIYAARFKVSENFNEDLASEFSLKRLNQPKGASFGSCFVNPSGDYAGRLIEAVGLKGKEIGGVKFSEQHANFLINFNHGSFDDAINLISLAKELVLSEFGIELKSEVVIL